MSYSDILKPRREVLSEEGVEGIIDLANVDDRRRRKLEARPADLFDLTYPTADTQRVVQTIHRRFSGDRDAPGLFLFEGLKGSGKSHLLVLVYHLFVNRAAGQTWLDRHQLACEVPTDAVVITAVQNRHKSSDPCCKQGTCVPGTGILRSRSAAVS